MADKLHIAKLALLTTLRPSTAGISQTHVATDGSQIAGFHTIVVRQFVHQDAPERLAKMREG